MANSLVSDRKASAETLAESLRNDYRILAREANHARQTTLELALKAGGVIHSDANRHQERT